MLLQKVLFSGGVSSFYTGIFQGAVMVLAIVFGSVIAFTAYVWLLGTAPISLVATYAYVNPVVAVILGALILDEPITPAILIGGAVIVVAVAIVIYLGFRLFQALGWFFS